MQSDVEGNLHKKMASLYLVSMDRLWAEELWLAVDSRMLGGSMQVWYDESITLEEMCSMYIQWSWYKSLRNISKKEKATIIFLTPRIATVSVVQKIFNYVHHNARTKRSSGLMPTCLQVCMLSI